jgi:hypothetical protein
MGKQTDDGPATRNKEGPVRERTYDKGDGARDRQAEREAQRKEKVTRDSAANRKEGRATRAAGERGERAKSGPAARASRANGDPKTGNAGKKRDKAVSKDGWKTRTIKDVTRVAKAINNTIVENGLGGVLNKTKQASGALARLGEQYQNLLGDGPMAAKTKSQNYDKYRHCLGHCGAAKEGLVGLGISVAIGVGREATDWISSENAKKSSEAKWGETKRDLKANFRGNTGMLSGLRCEAVCAEYREPWQK